MCESVKLHYCYCATVTENGTCLSHLCSGFSSVMTSLISDIFAKESVEETPNLLLSMRAMTFSLYCTICFFNCTSGNEKSVNPFSNVKPFADKKK